MGGRQQPSEGRRGIQLMPTTSPWPFRNWKQAARGAFTPSPDGSRKAPIEVLKVAPEREQGSIFLPS